MQIHNATIIWRLSWYMQFWSLYFVSVFYFAPPNFQIHDFGPSILKMSNIFFTYAFGVGFFL